MLVVKTRPYQPGVYRSPTSWKVGDLAEEDYRPPNKFILESNDEFIVAK